MKFWRTPLAIRTIHDSPTDLAKWLELARAPGGLTAETAEAEFRRDLGKALRSDVKIDWAEVAEHFNATASLEGVLTKVGRPFELELVHRVVTNRTTTTIPESTCRAKPCSKRSAKSCRPRT